jgi:hypothetical protein
MKYLHKFSVLMLLFFPALPARAQDFQSPTVSTVRWVFDTEFGSGAELGHTLSFTSFGPTVEYPVGDRFELQGKLLFGPTLSVSGRDGHSVETSALAIVWVNSRIGISAGAQHDWLWARQLNRSGWNPSLGVAVRDNLYRPGRFYASYLFPTGCNSNGPNSSCTSPSGRTQGLKLGQEMRLFPHVRAGFETGIFHFCNNSNTNGLSSCQLAGAAIGVLRFEFNPGTSVEKY